MISGFNIKFLLVLVSTVIVQGDKCYLPADCTACIQTPSCAWCMDPVLATVTGSRCLNESITNSSCLNSYSPQSKVLNMSQYEFISGHQISPKMIELELRIGVPLTFNLQVQPQMNIPLDIYFLMDLSYSMRDDLSNIQNLINDIGQTIENITNNYTVGFGSFVDKRVAPFIDTTPQNLLNPCIRFRRLCSSPYSYRHVVSLTSNLNDLKDGLLSQTVSHNKDNPEGGFDGLLQSIVCKDVIGWRNGARHILVYISDAEFHYAGDGKLGGAVIPHSGECLMNQQSNTPIDYTYYDVMDYPSISQIEEKLIKFNIIPIFAVETISINFYNKLANQLNSTGAQVGQLSANSNNIVTLLKDSYTRLSQRIIPMLDAVEGISFRAIPTSCPIIDEENKCDGLTIGQTAQFNITLELQSCTTTENMISAKIRVPGFGTTEIIVVPLCSCNCEIKQEINSTYCSNAGTLQCGICMCNKGRFGEFCECDGTGRSVGGGNTTQDCLTGPNELVCSGRGTCICGICECNKLGGGRRYYGSACECTNFDCERDPRNGLLCGGISRGRCECQGQCNCNSPYTGRACECTSEVTTCIDPSDSQALICNGRGECVCGMCICDGYAGQYCERCTNTTFCPVANCSDYVQNCAMCGIGLSAVDCISCVDTVIINSTAEVYANALTCDYINGNCEHRYYVKLAANGTLLPIQIDEMIVCSQTSVAAWIIAISVVFPLLLIGLFTIAMVKLGIMYLDYREYKKFEFEVKSPKFGQNNNPIFLSADVQYLNPAYKKVPGS